MESAEDTGSCGFTFFQILSKNGVGLPGIFLIGIFGFLRKGHRVQPVQKLQIHSHSPEAVLGSMKMKVCKSRDDQTVSSISYRDSLEFFRERGKYSCAFPVFADNIGMFSGDKSVFVCAEADVSF